MINTNEIKVFDGVNLSDIFKNVFVNNSFTKTNIDSVITNLMEKIKSVNDSIIIAPVVKDYLNTAIANDKVLLEMAKIVERLNNSGDGQLGVNGMSDLMMTAEDLQSLDEHVTKHFDDITEKTSKKLVKMKKNT